MTMNNHSQTASRWNCAPLCILAAWTIGAAGVKAGVEVRLSRSPEQAAYAPGEVVQVDVSLAQLPGGADQLVRMVEFDLQASSPGLGIAFPVTHDRGSVDTPVDVRFWRFDSLPQCLSIPPFCSFNHYVDSELPAGFADTRAGMISMAYYGPTADATAQLLLPNDGTPLTVGTLHVTMPAVDGIYSLDLLNAADPAAFRRARVDFGFDEHTTWRAGLAAPNNLIGGVLVFRVASGAAADLTVASVKATLRTERVRDERTVIGAAPFSGAVEATAAQLFSNCTPPSRVLCGATACTADAECVAPWGAGATCVRNCTLGPKPGWACDEDADCGRCDDAMRTSCDDAADCPSGACRVGVCGSGYCRDERGCCTEPDCDDGNPCTNDAYENGVCVYTNNSFPCDDGSLCTTGDACVNGACTGTLLNCNDGNACTDDSCGASGECLHVNNSRPCSDGLFCNGPDTCSGGSCSVHAGSSCPSNTSCDEWWRSCLPMFSLRAVQKNGVTIPTTSALTVSPGDTIVADIFVSGWATHLSAGLRIYEAVFNPLGFLSGSNGAILPLGWHAPPAPTVPCTSNADCAAFSPYTECRFPHGCVAPDHNPALGVRIDFARPDFVFAGQSVVAETATYSLRYKYFGLMTESIGLLDAGTPKYCGTLILSVTRSACGAFTIGFNSSESFMTDPFGLPTIVPAASKPLVLTVAECVTQVVDCDPGGVSSADHCDIDARIPHQPWNPSQKLTTNHVVFEFDRPSTGMSPADFEVSIVGPGPAIPSAIASVQANTPSTNEALVTMNGRIRPKQWTCVRHKLSGRRCCFGSLPADADWSRLSQVADIFELFDNLQGGVGPPLSPSRCDIDRDTVCNPADLVRAVDLLIGADTFEDVSGDSLPPCPLALTLP